MSIVIILIGTIIGIAFGMIVSNIMEKIKNEKDISNSMFRR